MEQSGIHGWRRNLLINGVFCFCSLIYTLVFIYKDISLVTVGDAFDFRFGNRNFGTVVVIIFMKT